MVNDINMGEGTDITQSELLNWMRGANITFGWDALVAFDRATINTVYREQYIRQYTAQRNYPMVSGAEKLLDETYRAVEKVILGPPIVSFELSSIVDTKPVVRVTLPIVSGYETRLTYEANGSVTVDRINHISTLKSPTVSGLLNFKALQQTGDVGVIALDLKDGTYELSIGSTQLEREKGGQIFKDAFLKWDRNDTEWIVNEVKRNTGVMAVEEFTLRSQRHSDTATLGDADYGAGAVVAFVKMEGNYENRSLPAAAKDLKYLVPNDPGRQFTATVIVKDIRVILAFIKNVLMSDRYHVLDPSPFSASVARTSGRGKLNVDEGHVELGTGTTTSWLIRESDNTVMHTFSFSTPIRPNASNMSFEIEPPSAENGQQPVMSMSIIINNANCPVRIRGRESGGGWGVVEEDSTVKISFTLVLRYTLRFDSASQSMKMQKLSKHASGVSCARYQFQSTIARWEEVEPKLPRVIDWYCESMGTQLDLSVPGFETFLLTGLLFGKPFETKLLESAIPQDAAMFGHVAPGQLDFTVATPFPVLLAGDDQHFFATSTGALAVWSVKNVPGQSTPIGTIGSTGRYFAPSLEEIGGSQVQVVVTATSSKTQASALVTIVPRSFELNPVLQTTKVGSAAERIIELGALPSKTPTWGPIPAAQGRLEAIADQPDARRFYPPQEPIPGVLVDIVTVTATAGSSTQEAFVVVQHNEFAMFQLLASAFNPASRTVQLSIPNIDFGGSWQVIGGNATIDSNGLLTADKNYSRPFVVVVASHEAFPGYPPMWGYTVLGLPLAPFPQKPSQASALSVSLD